MNKNDGEDSLKRSDALLAKAVSKWIDSVTWVLTYNNTTPQHMIETLKKECQCIRDIANAEPMGNEAVRSDEFFGLRVVGHEAPLPYFFATEAEASELRMHYQYHRYHSPACLDVVRIAVKPNDGHFYPKCSGGT